MDKITGYLIRYHRLKQNLSQEGLCKGICVVSYVSKIEQGRVEADTTIIHQLFDVLHIVYHDDVEFIKKGSNYIKMYREKKNFKEDDTNETTWLDAHEEAFLNSPLCIAYRLYKLDKFFTNIKERHDEGFDELAIFENCMSEDEAYQYHLLYQYHSDMHLAKKHVTLACKLKACAESEYMLGWLYFSLGDFFQTMEHAQKSYTIACEEGEIVWMMYASNLLGNCYACQNVEPLMMKYYNLTAKIARTLQDEEMKCSLYYNMGSTYLEWKQYEQAEEYLLLTTNTQQDAQTEFLKAHKLALLYIEKDEKEKGLLYLKKVKVLELVLPREDIMKMTEFLTIRYQNEYYKNARYCEILQEIYHMQDEIFFGYRLFHARYLIEILQYQRKYKEALQILKDTENRFFPKSF